MNWGTKITILYLGFVALIITLVSLSMSQKVELEAKDYYVQEIKYQDKIDAMNNNNALKETIVHEVNEKEIIIKLPLTMMNKSIEGSIYFLRPSDSDKDRKVVMSFDAEGKQRIANSLFSHGLYKMQLSWKLEGKKFFKEEVIFIK